VVPSFGPAGTPTTIRTLAALNPISLKHPSLPPKVRFDFSV
jgi:hypothetical protein